MGRLAPPPETEERFSAPAPSISFLGGPLDGEKMEGEPTGDIENTVFPEWIQPNGETHRYYLLLAEEPPAWIVSPPHADVLDQLYVWGPYYWTERGYVSDHRRGD